jgi:hypothetical protein
MKDSQENVTPDQKEIVTRIANRIEEDLARLGTINCNIEFSIDTKTKVKRANKDHVSDEMVHKLYFSKKTGSFAKEKLLHIDASQDSKTGKLAELNIHISSRDVFSIILNVTEDLQNNYTDVLNKDAIHIIRQF